MEFIYISSIIYKLFLSFNSNFGEEGVNWIVLEWEAWDALEQAEVRLGQRYM